MDAINNTITKIQAILAVYADNNHLLADPKICEMRDLLAEIESATRS